MKQLILFITLFGLLFIQSFGKNPDKDIVILYTNDVHCAIDYDDSTIGYPGLQFARFRISWLTDGIEADIEKAKKAKIEPLERKADKMAEKLGRLLEEIERIKSL